MNRIKLPMMRTRKVFCEGCGNEFETTHWRKKQCDDCKDSESRAEKPPERTHTTGKKQKPKNRKADADFNNDWIMKAL